MEEILRKLLAHCTSLYDNIQDNTYMDTSITPAELMHIDDSQYNPAQVAQLKSDIDAANALLNEKVN